MKDETRQLKEQIKEYLSGQACKGGKHVSDIADTIYLIYGGDGDNKEDLLKKINALLSREAKKKGGDFVKAKNPKTGKDRKGCYKLRREKKAPLPTPITPTLFPPIEKPIVSEKKQSNENLYKGKAGEYSVMAELLFRGYNVNNMAVDEGIDIVASKNNIFYYIQVKTTELRADYSISVNLKKDRFDTFNDNAQLRYIIVVRCNDKNMKMEQNIFFIFKNSDLDRFVYNKSLHASSDNLSIKIRFNQNTHKPVLYNDKEEAIDFYMNNFNL